VISDIYRCAMRPYFDGSPLIFDFIAHAPWTPVSRPKVGDF
jgi:hypothetical protein